MGLVIQIGPKDTFNIAERRFRLIEAFPETNTAHIQELGEEPLLVSYEKWTKISGSIALRLTQVSSRFSVKVDIEAPQTIPIWRNGKSWVEREDVALLAPVPIMHLESGLETVQQYGRVAFGSMAWERFDTLSAMLQGGPCQVFIYASHGQPAPVPHVTWVATYLRWVESRNGAHRDGLKYRPKSTFNDPSDNLGHWAIFWEVTDLRKLEPAERIPMDRFRGLGQKKNYLKTFRPEGPVLVEPL